MLTVVIPVFNGEKYIERSVNSVLNQTIICEIIIINDGSTDGTGYVCKKICKSHKNIKYIEIPNRGVSNARNVGINYCETEYISFLDCDDTYESDFAELMLDRIIKEKSEVSYCNRNNIENYRVRKNKIRYSKNKLLINYLKNKTAPQTNCWVIKKNFLEKNEIKFLTDISTGEDIIFFSSLLLKKPKISYVQNELVNYYVDIPNSLSKVSEEKIIKEIQWINILNQLIESSELPLKEKAILNTILYNYRMSVGILMNIINMDTTKESKKEELKKYKEIFNIFNLSNGLRSFKAILIYLMFLIK